MQQNTIAIGSRVRTKAGDIDSRRNADRVGTVHSFVRFHQAAPREAYVVFDNAAGYFWISDIEPESGL